MSVQAALGAGEVLELHVPLHVVKVLTAEVEPRAIAEDQQVVAAIAIDVTGAGESHSVAGTQIGPVGREIVLAAHAVTNGHTPDVAWDVATLHGSLTVAIAVEVAHAGTVDPRVFVLAALRGRAVIQSQLGLFERDVASQILRELAVGGTQQGTRNKQANTQAQRLVSNRHCVHLQW